MDLQSRVDPNYSADNGFLCSISLWIYEIRDRADGPRLLLLIVLPPASVAMVFQKVIVVDTRGHLLGRLASLLAKELLMGQSVVCVRCEETNISGTFMRNKRTPPSKAFAPPLWFRRGGPLLWEAALPSALRRDRGSRRDSGRRKQRWIARGSRPAPVGRLHVGCRGWRWRPEREPPKRSAWGWGAGWSCGSRGRALTFRVPCLRAQ